MNIATFVSTIFQEKFSRQSFIFCVNVSAIVLVAMTLIVHQRLSPYTLRNHERQLETFLIKFARNDRVDPIDFWKFREFYSVGSFSFLETATTQGDTQEIHALYYCGSYPFLYYASPKARSTEYLFCNPDEKQKPPLKHIVSESLGINLDDQDFLFFGDTLLIAKTGPETLSLFFSATPQDLRKTVGFFDFTPEEIQFTNMSLWVSRTDFHYTGNLQALRRQLSPKGTL